MHIIDLIQIEAKFHFGEKIALLMATSDGDVVLLAFGQF
jgi:hypothetical protein